MAFKKIFSNSNNNVPNLLLKSKKYKIGYSLCHHKCKKCVQFLFKMKIQGDDEL